MCVCIYIYSNKLLQFITKIIYIFMSVFVCMYIYFFVCLFLFLIVLDKINSSVGFKNVVTIDMLREANPLLDVVDHNRRPKDLVSRNNDIEYVSVTITI